MTLRIVTDSTADLPDAVTAEYGITVVPLTVLFGDEELRDGIDINSEQFFTRLQRERQLPTTSQPSNGAFRETYERLIAEGATDILSIHVSEKLSGTLASARQGADGARRRAHRTRRFEAGVGRARPRCRRCRRSGSRWRRHR